MTLDPQKPVVDFFIVGAMKSGTSSLRDMLRQHPGIDLHKGEIHYFSNPENFAKGEAWYHGHFQTGTAGLLHGDKSPPYGVDPKVPAQLHAYNPEARILWILRDPVRRAVSHYHHALKRNPEARSLEKAIEMAEELAARNNPTAYVYRSQYDRHLAAYDAFFPPEQQYVLIFEELLANPEDEARKLWSWMGLDTTLPVELLHSNEGVSNIKRDHPVSAATLAQLDEILAPTVTAMEARLGRKIDSWRRSTERSVEVVSERVADRQVSAVQTKDMNTEQVTDLLPNKVKVAIWDLDETFWKGTLSEEGVEFIEAHCDMVRKLADRGIVSTICSKNDFDTAAEVLRKHGIWDYFVFPHIDWTPKGSAVTAILDAMQLRAPNAVFLDDNHMNLHEVAFANPGIMCVDATQTDLVTLLDHPSMAGKDDSTHSRLTQYKVLEKKASERDGMGLDNSAFLRQSGIIVDIDYDVEGHMDRVIELINRTNQLNFTKQRLETSEAIEQFKSRLNDYGINAGVVKVRDRYGDYGVVGYFQTKRNFRKYDLEHFAFSCRTLNMGIEQYVYEQLDSPNIEIVQPVSNPIKTFEMIDWINTGIANDVTEVDNRKLVLLGGCDLLQVSVYCTQNRAEYVNRAEGTLMVRYDDPGFILHDNPQAVADSEYLSAIPSWTADEIRAFNTDIREAKIVILSMFQALTDTYFDTLDGHQIRLHPTTFKKILKRPEGMWFVKRFTYVPYKRNEKLELIRRALAKIDIMTGADAKIFLITEYTNKIKDKKDHALRKVYNAFVEDFCTTHEKFETVRLDELVADDQAIDSHHFTRQVYHSLAQTIMDRAPKPEAQVPEVETAASAAQ